ncbi:segregation/condensation protein A [Lactococcus termiticola]|uniref:Segregation and condensation protein A n=1 Tax=Lactococcus termiticola TaxID=2169526 RepID=A0A2R5HGQ2_9LACT|nr:segregation/condensation protein A [Lactococcus termiticola]GBG97194.1 segregation and condensation protein ScpA [Lactococcus termiticola]
MEEIKIKINDFEGPLDLLLHLVSQYKMDVFQVPLVPVIEQYLTYVNTMKNLELEIAGDYMVMASQLMLIKSRRLLPTVADEFQEDTEQLEQDILSQIDEYRKFKALSQELAGLHENRSQFYSKAKTEVISDDVVLLKDKSTIDLYLAFNRLLEIKQQMDTANNTTIEAEKYSIADKIVLLIEDFKHYETRTFSQLFAEDTSREEMLTTFLALLELIKNQVLSFEQEDTFAEISFRRNEQLQEEEADDGQRA